MNQNLPTIDREICSGCGACLSICPDRILAADTSGKALVNGDSCMQCGHCYAVCPVEAVSVPFLDQQEDLRSVKTESNGRPAEPLSPFGLLELMRQRRSCRLYLEETVDRVVLDDLVRAAVTAPSGTNSQGWKFIVLPAREQVIKLGGVTADFYRRLNRKAGSLVLRSLLRLTGNNVLQTYYENYFETVKKALDEWDSAGKDRLFHGAPAAIVVAADKASSCPGEDALLASQNILLMAEALGLGSCLIGYVVEAARRDASINRLLGLDKRYQVYSVIALGQPAVKFMRPAGRKPLKPEIVTTV
jgi:nitroreductase/Pyruvate/2-oxoacid:ferredoxin oxidoreductase delta subunit